MLVLSRRVGEAFVLRDAKTGALLARVNVGERSSAGSVRLLVDAPQSVRVIRAELEEGS